MREHLCIRRPEYVAGTSSKPEVGVFIQTATGRRPFPWGHLAPGETVWMKWTGGPVVAKAMISGFRQLPDTSPADLRQAVRGFALHGQEAYWRSLPQRFDGLAVFLTEEIWLEAPLVVAGRSHGASWLVFANATERSDWMATAVLSHERSPRDPRGPRTAAPALRFAVFRRDSFTCQYCGRSAPHVALHVDHVMPWADGGRTELSNLRTACNVCNLGKGKTHAVPLGSV